MYGIVKKVRSTKKSFGPTEVCNVPVQMTTRSQVLLLNSAGSHTFLGSHAKLCFSGYTCIPWNAATMFWKTGTYLPFSCSGSPSSTTSSQEHHPVAENAMSVTAAGINKTESPNIGPSHSNYYNDKLIGHVTGWQADHAERQVRLVTIVITTMTNW